MKFLYYSPVGESAKDLLPDVIARMIAAGGDVVIAIYDNWVPEDIIYYQPKVRIIRTPKMRKWQIAKCQFSPSQIQEYDYFFLWDDDLAISDFDPRRFLSIMEENDLYVAQPSILSRYELTHPITRQRCCGKILPDGRRVVGRFTNFVEIMAPVYSRKAWSMVYSFIEDANPEAFGYDYIPMGTKGIVDCMNVIHTRPPRSKDPLPFIHMEEFYRKSGFQTYKMSEMGALTETVAAPESVTSAGHLSTEGATS